MKKKKSLSIFLAATSALAISSSEDFLKAEEYELGGLKDWNTDMALEADFILDDEAQKLADEAKKSSTCIPIGEGENCW